VSHEGNVVETELYPPVLELDPLVPELDSASSDSEVDVSVESGKFGTETEESLSIEFMGIVSCFVTPRKRMITQASCGMYMTPLKQNT
jgi:hypothetical protein